MIADMGFVPSRAAVFVKVNDKEYRTKECVHGVVLLLVKSRIMPAATMRQLKQGAEWQFNQIVFNLFEIGNAG